MAFQALWKGLLYDAATLDDALALAPRLNHEDATSLRAAVARDALQARHANARVSELAKETLSLAARGLRNIAPNEESFLDILRAQVEDEICPADILLRNWHGSWHGSMSRVVEYLRIA